MFFYINVEHTKSTVDTSLHLKTTEKRVHDQTHYECVEC